MFIAELQLYIDYLKEQLEYDTRAGNYSKKKKYFACFYENLRGGITYYRQFSCMLQTGGKQFLRSLNYAGLDLDLLNFQYSITNK